MSMITELVDRLRKDADFLDKHSGETEEFVKDYKEAAEVISELSAKLQSANMERTSTRQKVRNDMDGIKEIKGFSSMYPYICNLKLLPNIDGTWITIQDDVGTSMTVKLSDLSDFICCNKISNVISKFPKTYSDKIYDASTIDEGIEEIERVGIRKGLELAITLIKAESEEKHGL